MNNEDLSVVTYSWNPNTWVVDTKRLGVQDHPPLYREFKEASLDYKRHPVLDLGVVANAFNSSTQKEEEYGYLWIQGKLVLPSKLQAHQGYVVRHYLKKQNLKRGGWDGGGRRVIYHVKTKEDTGMVNRRESFKYWEM